MRELGFAIARIILGMVALTGGLIALVIIGYLSTAGSFYGEKIATAYNGGYKEGYKQTYHVAYNEARVKVYDRGYKKGYEIGLNAGASEGAATRVRLRNPTYEELKEFLAQDKTDTNLYVPGEYVSFDFAVELNNNAEREGIRAAFVTVFFPERSHGIVAFETADKGLIFIEPQSDTEVELVTGEFYWRSAGGIRSKDYDDTIVEIQLLW